MASSISNPRMEICPRCRSWLVSLEWDERINEREVEELWHCWACQNEFTTLSASEEQEPSFAEITRPYFTSLVME